MKKALWIGLITMMTVTCFAGEVLQWQDNSLSLLYGNHFKLDPESQTTMTYEHVSGWSAGDLFFFVDGIYFNGDKDFKDHNATYYGELAPRLSAGKILDKDLSVWFIQDFLLSGCFEFGENSTENILAGGAVDLKIPGFDFFQLNLYRRFDDWSSDVNAYQLTPVWKVSVPVGKSTFVCDGFIDYVFGDGTDHVHICPQLKFDIGVLFGMEEQKLFAGVEYDYWKNKYGVRDGDFGLKSDQNTFSGLIKYHF